MQALFAARPLLSTFLVTLCVQITTYIIAVVKQFDTITDLSGSTNFIVLAWVSLYFANLTRRKIVLTLLVTVWAIRLGSYLFTRVLKRGKDDRFDKIRINPVRFFIFFMIQALWVWIVSLPVTLALSAPIRTKINRIDYLGWALWGIGFMWEVIADYQKSVFNSNPENKNKILRSGLYYFSRYPSYFGEILLWFGIFISCTNNLVRGNIFIGFLSPLFTFYLLRYLSGVPLSEKRYNARFEKIEDVTEEWEEYKRTTNLLIPGIPK